MRKLPFIVVLSLVLCAAYAGSAHAANFTVTKSTNSNDGACDSDCSLREAVAAADSGDTVVFAGYLIGETFTLGGAEIVITKRITIDGALAFPAVVHISGEDTNRIFLIEAGGALDLRSAVLLLGNAASSSFDAGRGSAINAKQAAALTLDRVAIRNNTATVGAVIVRTGTHHFTNSSFTTNTASTCIAIYNQDAGANLYLANVTLRGNFDPGNDQTSSGAICNNGNLTIRNSTIAYNFSEIGGSAGGIFNVGGGVLNLGNTIVAQNTADFAPDIDSINSTVTSVGGNLIGDTEGTPAGTFTQPNDITGVNPLLAPTNSSLDGFPVFSHPLQAGSPARNGGLNANAVDPLTNAPLTTDTRGVGFPRIVDTTVDIGAFEDASGNTSLIVSKNQNSNDLVCDDDCSLREAVHQASLNSGTETITFAANVFGTLTLGGSEIVIQNHNVNIVGKPNSAGTIVVSGGDANRIFAISNASVLLRGLTLADGNGVGMFSGAGGAIQAFNDSNVTLDRVIMRDNFAANYGAMQATGGVTRVINSTISQNSANSSLALGIVGGTLHMANATINANLDADGGSGLGALHINGSVANIRNSTIAFNRTSAGTGGGIYLISSSVNLGNTIVSNNIAPNGPDIFRSSGTLTSVGGNLVQDVNGFPAGTFNQTSDHTGSDPQLDALADNGGSVPTNKIQAFSVAVNKGVNANAVDPFDNSPLGNDARGQGFPRILGGMVDKGAFESPAPTAAAASISGIITNQGASPVAGVVVRLDGSMMRKTITDANGRYQFENVATNGFYTVTPSRVNYGFSPAQRSFSLLAANTEATFAAIPNAVPNANPLDSPEYFVRQHYLDFLGREPDEAGFNFWSDQIIACGTDAGCLERRRSNVSAAYFLSIEFQETGGLVDGLYRASYGRRPFYNEFMPDTAAIAHDTVVGRNGWEGQLEENKQAFVAAFVQRAAFKGLYEGLSNTAYVDTLIGHTEVSFTAAERDQLVVGLTNGTMTRADILRQVAENERFKAAKFNQTFVMMEYFGYLRRDPDDSGYQFWLNKLNQFGGNFEQAEMVKAFILSGEYRNRFPN